MRREPREQQSEEEFDLGAPQKILTHHSLPLEAVSSTARPLAQQTKAVIELDSHLSVCKEKRRSGHLTISWSLGVVSLCHAPRERSVESL